LATSKIASYNFGGIILDVITQIHDVAEIASAAATVILAWLVYQFSRKQEIDKSTGDIQKEWQNHNAVVLGHPELIAMEGKLHPNGQLTDEQVRRMYLHFMTLNVCYNSWANGDEVDRELAQSTINNSVNRMYSDREFVFAHVLPRGYPLKFTAEIRRRMDIIEKTGSLLPMV
jgi:hypothetical protein